MLNEKEGTEISHGLLPSEQITYSALEAALGVQTLTLCNGTSIRVTDTLSQELASVVQTTTAKATMHERPYGALEPR